MGTVTAPVVGSGCWPAWMQSVAKPMVRHYGIGAARGGPGGAARRRQTTGCARRRIHFAAASGGPGGCDAAPPRREDLHRSETRIENGWPLRTTTARSSVAAWRRGHRPIRVPIPSIWVPLICVRTSPVAQARVREQAALGQAGHLDAHDVPVLHHGGDRRLGQDAGDLLAQAALDLDPAHLARGGLGVLGGRARGQRRAGQVRSRDGGGPTRHVAGRRSSRRSPSCSRTTASAATDTSRAPKALSPTATTRVFPPDVRMALDLAGVFPTTTPATARSGGAGRGNGGGCRGEGPGRAPAARASRRTRAACIRRPR